MKTITKKFDLPCMDGSQNSFYGKAIVCETWNGVKILKSYETIVAYIDYAGLHKTWNGYSRTTMLHVNNFLLFYGLKKINKKEWVNMDTELKPFVIF